MNIITSNDITFDILSSATHLPNEQPIDNIDILQHFPRTSSYSRNFHQKMAMRVEQEFGFSQRYWVCPPWESLSDYKSVNTESMMIKTLEDTIQNTIDTQIDSLIFGTTTSSRYTGSQAAAVLGAYKIKAAAYDVKAGCSTSLASLNLAYSLMSLGQKNILVSCAETLSKVIDPNNERTWYGVADGAANLWLQKNSQGQFSVEKLLFETDGQFVDLYTTQALLPPTEEQVTDPTYTLQGDESQLKSLAINAYTSMLESLLPKQQDRDDITWLIPHQVNRKLIDELIKEFNLDHVKVLWDADKIGNIGGASILYTLANAWQNDVFNKPGKLLMMSVGGGLSYAAQIINVHGCHKS